MKKAITYSFLFLFLFSALGYFPVFLLRQYTIRTEIKQKIKNEIPEKELVVFYITKEEYSNLDWEKENKEFHLRNTLYDIVRLQTDEYENIILFCINDFQEEQLFTNLENEVKKNTETSLAGKNILKIFKLLSNTFPVNCFGNLYNTGKEKVTSPPYFQTFFLSFISQIPAPPPRSV